LKWPLETIRGLDTTLDDFISSHRLTPGAARIVIEASRDGNSFVFAEQERSTSAVCGDLLRRSTWLRAIPVLRACGLGFLGQKREPLNIGMAVLPRELSLLTLTNADNLLTQF
jgi:hypothetical protein